MSPTDVSPTENSWMLRPWNKASLGHCVPDRCVPTLDRVNHGTSSVGRYRGLGRPPAPNGSVGRLAGFAYAPDQVYWIGTPPSDARSATHRIKSKGWDGSVRGKIAKGHFVQGINIQEFSVGDTSVGDGLTLHHFFYKSTITIYAPMIIRPVRNVFDAGRYIMWASGRGLGPGNHKFFGPCEMTSSQ